MTILQNDIAGIDTVILPPFRGPANGLKVRRTVHSERTPPEIRTSGSNLFGILCHSICTQLPLKL